METYEYNHNHFDPRNPYAGDEKNPIQFYMGALKNDAESEVSGRPIYGDVEFIRIFNSKDNIIERPVRDTDKGRWPKQYAAWKNTGESIPGAAGTRLEVWPPIAKSVVEELKYFKIFTVEQLATMPDSLGSPVMGFKQLQAQARAYLDLAKGAEPVMHLQAELDAEKLKNSELENRLGKMERKMERIIKNQPAEAGA